MDEFDKRAGNPDIPVGEFLDVQKVNHTTFEDLIMSSIENFRGVIEHPEREGLNLYPETVEEFAKLSAYLSSVLDEYEFAADSYRAANPRVLEEGYTPEQGEDVLAFFGDVSDVIYTMKQCSQAIADPDSVTECLLDAKELDEVVDGFSQRLKKAHDTFLSSISQENWLILLKNVSDEGLDDEQVRFDDLLA